MYEQCELTFVLLLDCSVPEACAMGWMGQHFHKRFKLDKERLPPPGSAELDSVFLFPGRNAGQLAVEVAPTQQCYAYISCGWEQLAL